MPARFMNSVELFATFVEFCVKKAKQYIFTKVEDL